MCADVTRLGPSILMEKPELRGWEQVVVGGFQALSWCRGHMSGRMASRCGSNRPFHKKGIGAQPVKRARRRQYLSGLDQSPNCAHPKLGGASIYIAFIGRLLQCSHHRLQWKGDSARTSGLVPQLSDILSSRSLPHVTPMFFFTSTVKHDNLHQMAAHLY